MRPIPQPFRRGSEGRDAPRSRCIERGRMIFLCGLWPFDAITQRSPIRRRPDDRRNRVRFAAAPPPNEERFWRRRVMQGGGRTCGPGNGGPAEVSEYHRHRGIRTPIRSLENGGVRSSASVLRAFRSRDCFPQAGTASGARTGTAGLDHIPWDRFVREGQRPGSCGSGPAAPMPVPLQWSA